MTRGRRGNPDLDARLTREFIELRYMAGATFSDIAKEAGCDDWAVRSRFDKYGLTRRYHSETMRIVSAKRSIRHGIPEDAVRRRINQVSAAQIARELGVGPGLVQQRLRDLGITPEKERVRRSADLIHDLLPAWRFLYVERSFSFSELGRVFGMDREAIKEELTRDGIDIRSQSEQQRLDYMSEESRIKMSAACRKIPLHEWDGYSSNWRTRMWNSSENQAWRKAVFERDEFRCKTCGVVGGKLEAHHIIPVRRNRKLLFEITNGITLCELCHFPTIRNERAYFERYAAMTGLTETWPE